MDGWALLDQLKHDPATRHIPVTVISVVDEKKRGFQAGAFNFLEKPVDREMLFEALARTKEFVDREVKSLLLVEDDEHQRTSIAALVEGGDVAVTAVGSGERALDMLQIDRYDCMIVDLGLPDMNGVELIERVRRIEELANLPIVVYTGRDLTPEEEARLLRLAETIILKDADSATRLFDETALFLHRTLAKLPEDKQRILIHFQHSDRSLKGKKVLIIDDDVRNIFSLTSALERHEMEIVFAENGADGIAKLRQTPDIDAVLVDIMMPEMDGYETMRAIRSYEAFRTLPLIAVTAKAMKGDREKCIEAGATDYIAKPVDLDQLVSTLRVRIPASGNGGSRTLQ
jgi:CheY-like chemotaxis protein